MATITYPISLFTLTIAYSLVYIYFRNLRISLLSLMSCWFSINAVLETFFLSLLSLFTHKQIGTSSFNQTDNNNDDDDGKCELVGTFSLVTQAFLGLLCLSSLILKRHYEWPVRRTWPVWFFDVSKQLLGALGVHIFNVTLSIIKTLKDAENVLVDYPDIPEDEEDPCSWYFLNIVFDCTIGVYILYLVFRLANKVCRDYFHISNIESGQYGDPNKPNINAYLKQLSIYYISLIITKGILFVVMDLFEKELLWITSHILLVWLHDYPNEVEIFMVMFVIPIFMNCLQLILVDNIIQNPYFRIRNKLPDSDEDADQETYTSESLLREHNESSEASNDSYGTFV